MCEITSIETEFGVCQLSFSTRRRTLAISVHPDGRLEAIAPEATSREEILVRLKKRKSWVLKQRRIFESYRAERPPLRFVSGATHRYLGKQYRLKIISSETSSVKLKHGFFYVETDKRKNEAVEALLEAWYRDKARQQFEKRLKKWERWCAKRNLPEPKLMLRKMPKRWGSAHLSGKIYLNPELIKMPSLCIDYVISHEICHLQHPHHGPSFYSLLDQLCPGWKKHRARLQAL